LLDAAQSLGHLPVSVKDLGVDLLAAAGHKGLLGPLGTGLLYIRKGLESLLDSVRQGGTGSASFDDHQPLTLPGKYESGNPNAPGLVGLGAGAEFLTQRGLVRISQDESALTARLISAFAQIPGVRIHGAPANAQRLGVVSITFADRSSTEVAAILDQTYGVQVRAGYHCAALIHDALGTRDSEGTVRFSVGPFNTEEDIDSDIEAVEAIAQGESPTIASPRACACVAAASGPAPGPGQPTSSVGGAYGNVSEIPGIRELWEHTLGDPGITIAVLDGSVDLAHPCFEGAFVEEVPALVSMSVGRGIASRHGTAVASILFGQHQSPIRGISPRCKALVIPIYGDSDALESPRCSHRATAS